MKKLSDIIERHGWKHSRIAELAGLSRVDFSRTINGQRVADESERARIIGAINYLLTGAYSVTDIFDPTGALLENNNESTTESPVGNI